MAAFPGFHLRCPVADHASKPAWRYISCAGAPSWQRETIRPPFSYMTREPFIQRREEKRLYKRQTAAHVWMPRGMPKEGRGGGEERRTW